MDDHLVSPIKLDSHSNDEVSALSINKESNMSVVTTTNNKKNQKKIPNKTLHCKKSYQEE